VRGYIAGLLLTFSAFEGGKERFAANRRREGDQDGSEEKNDSFFYL